MSEKILKVKRMPLLPIRGLTVFPEMVLHFDVGRERSVSALSSAMEREQLIFLASQKNANEEEPEKSGFYHIGTVSVIRQIIRMPGENVRILVEGKYRARIIAFHSDNPFWEVDVEELVETMPELDEKSRAAYLREAHDAFDNYAAIAPRMTQEVISNIAGVEDPGYLSDYIAQNIPVSYIRKQAILEECDKLRRVEKITALLYEETDILEAEVDIHSRVREQINHHRRESYLREQLKEIRRELGEDEEGSEADVYRDKVLALGLPDDSRDKLLKETERLRKMYSSSAEANVITTYLDTVLELPWNTVTIDSTDLMRAKKVLDRDHFGLDKIKERIIEYLAVESLTSNNKSQILCLVGPPGVGKTSIAFSVAKALGRKMARLSLGGIRDEADIRGHRKTYVGAMPGRIINAIKHAGSKNALILLDEVDKLGNDFRGDPASALLEVLDPEQNSAFRDHYIELPFDLSDVMFITTANTTSTIPRPLLDRMEVIELTSYTDEEKVQIAKRHLLPKQLSRHGLDKKQLKLSDSILREIIACYTKESGVRNLERELAAVCRKAAKSIALDNAAVVKVTGKNIEELLGPRRFKPEHKRKNDEIGVVCGLAWTSVGGELLEAEVNAIAGSGSLEITGNLGSIMKESIHAAITYIRSRAAQFGINPRFHKEMDIHIHFPEGAIPKDGPSAGITIATAIVSALVGAPVRRDIAMTGEITLRGRVLAIGGLKEKTMAAYRSGITTVILPADNESDLLEIDPTVRGALNFILVDNADKVIKTAVDFSRRTVPAWEPSRETPSDQERQVMPPMAELKHRGQAVLQ